MRALVFEGPKPPSGAHFCAVCLGIFKAQVLALPDVSALIQANQQSREPGPPLVISLRTHAVAAGIMMPEIAVGVGLQQVWQNVMTEVCWGHAMGIAVSSVLPGSAQMLEQLGNVPLLGGRG